MIISWGGGGNLLQYQGDPAASSGGHVPVICCETLTQINRSVDRLKGLQRSLIFFPHICTHKCCLRISRKLDGELRSQTQTNIPKGAAGNPGTSFNSGCYDACHKILIKMGEG